MSYLADTITDEDLDAAATVLCETYIDLVIKPAANIEPAFRFCNLREEGQEIYRELVLAVIETLDARSY